MSIKGSGHTRSVSLGAVHRRDLGDDVNHEVQKAIEDQYDYTESTRRKEVMPIWPLITLLVLLSTRHEKQILLDNYVVTAIQGLYAIGGILALVSLGCVCINRLRHPRRPPTSGHVSGLINTRKIFNFVSTCRYSVLSLVCALTFRIAIEILFSQCQQCLIFGVEGLVPLGYLIWRNWNRYIRGRPKTLIPSRFGIPSTHFNLNIGRDSKIALMLGVSVWTMSSMLMYPRSTMICESELASLVINYQVFAILADICIIASMDSCMDGFLHLEISILPGWSLLISMISFFCAPILLMISNEFKIFPSIDLLASLDASYYQALLREVFIVGLGVLISGRVLSSDGVMTLLSALISGYVISKLAPALANRDGLAPIDYAQALLTISCLFVATIYARQPRNLQRADSHKRRLRPDYMFYFTLGVGFCAAVVGLFSDIHGRLQEHPIDTLIYSADQAHAAWAVQAKQSQSLQEAAINYQKRYNRLPPPEFDIWYNFAVGRNSDVIDDFDNIERDLAPFRALSPAELRERIKETVDDPFNEVGVIKIRKGKTSVDQRFEGHRWMMDVVVLMTEYFLSSLPDMDIPFNINDEPRVVVPYDQMQEILAREIPQKSSSSGGSWSNDTGELLDAPRQTPNLTTFENWSFKNNFKKYSTLACPPNSAVHTAQSSWLPSRLCIWCTTPHSTSQFVKNWTAAGDPCHQPDLESLHGFYQGPGAYKVTKKLLPVFSASKPQGYSDILYPSLWEWDDGQRVRYAPNKQYPSPDYANKSTTLFWRGATAEGFTRRGEWRTYSRQRFVHMTSKDTQSLPVYMPESDGADKYSIQHLDRESLVQHAALKEANLKLDTGFTAFEKAWGDLEYETKVFGTIESEDYQANWQHKYLMTLDEGSASKSFIPFVQSNSLPFRATIFREWFDDRLTAWKHFVPIDLRFHGLWSTLAYFVGGFGTIRSIEGLDAGEFIAESGRLWGSRTLRRDDMEIYFFRLLLEWGRLIDDRRDEIGFQI